MHSSCMWDAVHHFPTGPQLSLQSLDHNSSLTLLPPPLPPWLLPRSQGGGNSARWRFLVRTLNRRLPKGWVSSSLFTHTPFPSTYLPSHSDRSEGGQSPQPQSPSSSLASTPFQRQFCPSSCVLTPACPGAGSAVLHLHLHMPRLPFPCYSSLAFCILLQFLLQADFPE